MKAMQISVDDRVFGGLIAVIAESLAQKRTRSTVGTASRPSVTGPKQVTAQPEGLAKRLGQWFWRQKRHGVEADLARSKDVFMSLDRWLWKQQMRETEAYLAQSKDIFDLESRMRRLERGPSSL